MAINLAGKYEKKIAEKFTRSSFVAPNVSDDYNFEGARAISIYTPQTVGINDYVREGLNRFGTPGEMQDEVQILTLSQDKGFSITIDRGNNSDQMMVKNAGRMLNMQIAERVVPYMDKYALDAFARQAGQIKGVSAPTKSTVVSMIFDGAYALDNALVPDEGRVLYLPACYYNMVRLSSEFQGVDALAGPALEKGCVGTIADMKCIKVPDRYFPEGVYFIIAHRGSVIFPCKIKTARVLTDVQGIDGAVLEGRNYFDAFVIGAKADGVYVAADSSKVTALPTLSVADGSATLSCTTSGASIRYTVDGSDPRYSKSAQSYTAAVTLAEGQSIRAYAEKSGMLPSGVVEG